MIKTVEKRSLPVDEQLMIQKNRIASSDGCEDRLAIVTGIHGDELDGQYICYELGRRLQEQVQYLHGVVDIYPALNPLGIDAVQREFPASGMDMNSIFPGTEDGMMMESVAARIVDDLIGARLCIDIHSSNVFLKEIPQVRITSDMEDKLLPFAKLLNTELIWIREPDTVLEATFSYCMNCMGVPALTVEMGVGMYITRQYGKQIVDGIFRLMQELGMWTGPVEDVCEPNVTNGQDVHLIVNSRAGVFIPLISAQQHIRRGQKIGEIVSAVEGKVIEEIISSVDGMVFTLREYPVVYKGALLARVVTEEKGDE